jgi:hypothetical protein
MRGSINGFEFGVDLLFDIGKRGGRNVLDLAVLVRRSSELPSKSPDPAFLRPPMGATSGGGGTVGPFTLQFWLPQRELWVDGVQLLAVPIEDNVVLIDERPGALISVGTEQVSLDFESDAPTLRSADPSPLDVWSDLLRQGFARSPRVASFLASSAHPSFKPLPDHKNIRGKDFAPGIDSWYSIAIVKGRPQLQCAVLVKLSDASRNTTKEPAWRRAPPFASGPASGATFGPHDIVYDIERSMLWVDGAAQPSPDGANVYLFRERSGSLELVGTLAIDPDLRASPRWRDAVLSSPVFRELTVQSS